MSDMQLRAHTGVMNQGSADIQGFQGTSESYKDDARAEFNRQIANLGDGVGTETVAAIRAKFEEYLDSHLDSIKAHQTGLTQATETMTAGGKKMTSLLGNNG